MLGADFLRRVGAGAPRTLKRPARAGATRFFLDLRMIVRGHGVPVTMSMAFGVIIADVARAANPAVVLAFHRRAELLKNIVPSHLYLNP